MASSECLVKFDLPKINKHFLQITFYNSTFSFSPNFIFQKHKITAIQIFDTFSLFCHVSLRENKIIIKKV